LGAAKASPDAHSAIAATHAVITRNLFFMVGLRSFYPVWIDETMLDRALVLASTCSRRSVGDVMAASSPY
jgi:hypothetical protein